MNYEVEVADYGVDSLNKPKQHKGMTKSEKRKVKEFRKNRQQARGRRWQDQ